MRPAPVLEDGIAGTAATTTGTIPVNPATLTIELDHYLGHGMFIYATHNSSKENKNLTSHARKNLPILIEI